VVCAAIDEGNRSQVKAAEAEAERLATEVFPDLRVDLLHGRMRPKDKEAVMDRFRAAETDILISTTVIEVGVDIPNATVMLVENAERFGLAQLHQLRGRIGRGAHRSYCILFDESDAANEEARARIDAMVRTTDGFELADEDLGCAARARCSTRSNPGCPTSSSRAWPTTWSSSGGPASGVRGDRGRSAPGSASVAVGGAPVAVRVLDRLALPLLRPARPGSTERWARA
jgi:hypothetical protein